MKRVFNGVSLVLIALLTFFMSGFYFIGSEENFEILDEDIVQNVFVRSLGFWMFGFMLLAILVLANYILYRRRTQSYITILVIGTILNLIFSILGSLVFFLA